MKMEEWKEYKLTEIMDLIGGGTPKTSNPDYWDGDIPWISVKDFNGERRYVGETEKKITKLGLENSSTKILSKGDIIISARGTVGELAIIPSDMAFNQSCYGLRAKDFVDSTFLYYLLKQSVNILKHNTHGSVFDTITRETFENITVKLPPLPTQQKIAAILSSLDDKIELNNKINTNLEQQAQALFKNWFVDFEPFGGKMPEGWKVGKLCDIADYSSEKIEINKLTPETYYSTENMLPSKGGIETATSLPSISQTTRCLPGETIISNIRPYFKKIFYCTEEVAGCSTDVLCFKPKYKDYSEYLYQVLYSDIFFDYMVLGSKGTKMPRGDKQQIMNYPITIPNELYLRKFKTFAEPIFSQIDLNRKENKRLSELRDTLLPKLMNGEIRQY